MVSPRIKLFTFHLPVIEYLVIIIVILFRTIFIEVDTPGIAINRINHRVK